MDSPGHNAYMHAYGGQSSAMVDFLDGLNHALDTPANFVQGCESNQTSKDDQKENLPQASPL